MGDVRTDADLKFPQIDEMKMSNQFKIKKTDATVCKDSSHITVDLNEIPPNSLDQTDLMTRSLNFCRSIPGMGIAFAFIASFSFSSSSLVVKFLPINPLVLVFFQ